jgi:hypothetical protein
LGLIQAALRWAGGQNPQLLLMKKNVLAGSQKSRNFNNFFIMNFTDDVNIKMNKTGIPHTDFGGGIRVGFRARF